MAAEDWGAQRLGFGGLVGWLWQVGRTVPTQALSANSKQHNPMNDDQFTPQAPPAPLARALSLSLSLSLSHSPVGSEGSLWNRGHGNHKNSDSSEDRTTAQQTGPLLRLIRERWREGEREREGERGERESFSSLLLALSL